MELGAAYGLADRRYRIPNGLDTLFGIASGTKSLTAATVISLVEDGVLELGTTARSLLGANRPRIRDAGTAGAWPPPQPESANYSDRDAIPTPRTSSLPVPVTDFTAT